MRNPFSNRGLQICALLPAAALLLISISTAAFSQVPAPGDVVTRWNVIALDYLKAKNIPNQQGSRTMAMLHTSMYNAINAVFGTHSAYKVDLGSPPGTSPEAAAISAANHVLSTLYSADAEAPFIYRYREMMAEIPDGDGKASGVEFGRIVAQAIIDLRADDQSVGAESVPYPDGTETGKWRRTGAALPLMPGWGRVTPWTMTRKNLLRQAGPPPLRSAKYQKAYSWVKAIGAKNSTLRTVEQTAVAMFWIGGIPEHWHAIAREISFREGLTLAQNARLFALLSLGLADASISGWNMKYRYGFWRPVTAIREGVNDTNRRTVGDPSWEPLIMTPPFPEYPSGHSITCATAATILKKFFRGKNYTFTRESSTPNQQPRTFNSFWQAAEEAGRSRIYAGVHFSFSNGDALTAGKKLGDFVYDHYLRKTPRKNSRK